MYVYPGSCEDTSEIKLYVINIFYKKHNYSTTCFISRKFEIYSHSRISQQHKMASSRGRNKNCAIFSEIAQAFC